MVKSDEAVWRVEQFPIPRQGHWNIRLDILINDFEKIILQGKIDAPDSKVGSEDESTAGKISDQPD